MVCENYFERERGKFLKDNIGQSSLIGDGGKSPNQETKHNNYMGKD